MTTFYIYLEFVEFSTVTRLETQEIRASKPFLLLNYGLYNYYYYILEPEPRITRIMFELARLN